LEVIISNENPFPHFRADGYDLNNLTILLTTFNRPLYLLRQILYLSNWNVSVEIVDGSDQPLNPQIVEFISNEAPNINYRYLKLNLQKRIMDATLRIKTPFTMVMADDDLYLEHGIFQAIKILEKDSKLSACCGQILGLDSLTGKKYKNFYTFEYASNLTGYSITSDEPLQRIKYGTENYRSALFYSVYKTSTFCKVWNYDVGSKFNEIIEYESAIRTILYGGFKTIPYVYMLRSFEIAQGPSQINKNEHSEILYLKNRVANLLCGEGIVSISNSESTADLIINNLFYRKLSNSLSDRNLRLALYEATINILGDNFFFNKIKSSKIWVRNRSRISWLLRRKIKLRNKKDTGDNEYIERILLFCTSFDIYHNN
jgi:glycosyltransferase domain-containing protein